MIRKWVPMNDQQPKPDPGNAPPEDWSEPEDRGEQVRTAEALEAWQREQYGSADSEAGPD